MPKLGIRFEGLDELRQGLRRVDGMWGKELGQVNKSIGTQVVRWSEDRQSQMSSQYPSYRSGVVSVKASANQRRVEVNVRPGSAESGTARHPVFGRWMDQSLFSRRVWPDKSQEGWLVNPTLVEHEDRIGEEYLEAVTGLIRKVIGG